MQLSKSRIISNIQLGQNIYLIRVENLEIAGTARSGQFVNIRVTDDYSPLWRRPFSIHRLNRQQGWFELLFAVLGKGTRILSEMKAKDTLDILGPLGSCFNFLDDMNEAILVAGGLGIAPLLLLAEELKSHNISTVLFYGTKTKDTMCCLEHLNNLGIKCILTTEDGSKGYKGLVTDKLAEYIAGLKSTTNHHVYTCGPIPMLRRVQTLLSNYGIQGQMSIETLMACGIGVCMGCSVETTESEENNPNYKLTCVDGPVFNIDRIQLNG